MTVKPLPATVCLLAAVVLWGISATAIAQTMVATDPLQPQPVVQQAPLPGQPLGYTVWMPRPYAVPAYPYAYVYNPRRAYRQSLRYGYPPLFRVWPPVPSVAYPYPYPAYPLPPAPVQPQAAPDAVLESPPLEPIPAPSTEPGPRQF